MSRLTIKDREIGKGKPLLCVPVMEREEGEIIREITFLANVLEDKDAYPVTGGFTWIHWLAANITRFEIKDNESQTATDFVQGRNSWTSIQGGEQSVELSSYYGGMTPPDQPHIYELHVFAIDKMLDIGQGFLLNELYRAMEGHILAQYTLKGVYKN